MRAALLGVPLEMLGKNTLVLKMPGAWLTVNRSKKTNILLSSDDQFWEVINLGRHLLFNIEKYMYNVEGNIWQVEF